MTHSVRAAEVPYLYRAEIVVSDQLPKTRQLAIKQAMQTVLIRVTGNTDISKEVGIAELVKYAERYLTQFSYQQIEQPIKAKDAVSASFTTSAQRVLVVDFQSQAIESLLRSKGISIWPAGRPRVLIWLTRESTAGREWVNFNTEPAAYAELELSLNKRGLPFELPFLDLQDEQQLPLSMAGGLLVDAIRSASSRYQSDAILVGRSHVDAEGQQQSDWVLIDGRNTHRYRTSAAPGENQFDHIIDQVADYFANQYTKLAKPVDEFVKYGIEIEVLNITHLDQYASLLRYIEQLSPVKSAYPSVIMPEQIRFHINTDLSLEQFYNLIKLDRKLLPAENLRYSSSDQPASFYWKP